MKMWMVCARWMLTVIVFIAVLFVGYILLRPAHTPSISAPTSVAELDRLKIGGVEQYILIRGDDAANPVLLFLHGGPGMPMMYLAYRFQRPLEKHFIVVQWDRRGAGKSYDPNIPTNSMSVSQEISDARELVNYLRVRFHQQRIYLVGHSYGTYLGMLLVQRYPQLFSAYVAIAQLACSHSENAAYQEAWIRRNALAAHDAEALAQLDGKKPLDTEHWLFKYGGELRGATSFVPLLLMGLSAPEYTFSDGMNVPKGVRFTHKNMRYDVIKGGPNAPLMDAVPAVGVPVYFFTGKYDETDPQECTQQYFQRLRAPQKRLVWFTHSAHFPFLEEPDKFVNEVNSIRTDRRFP